MDTIGYNNHVLGRPDGGEKMRRDRSSKYYLFTRMYYLPVACSSVGCLGVAFITSTGLIVAMGRTATYWLPLKLALCLTAWRCRGGASIVAFHAASTGTFGSFVSPAAAAMPGGAHRARRASPRGRPEACGLRHGEGRRCVAPLAMSRELGDDPQESAVEVGTNSLVLEGGLTREKLIVGGWSALLGLAYVGGKRDQGSYRDRKRNLFNGIAGDEFRWRRI